MPKLKCIGGPLDGKEFEFSEREIAHKRSGDAVRLPELSKLQAATVSTDSYNNQSKMYNYIYSRLHFHGSEDIVFLRPSDWSDYRAIRHQMNK